MKVWLFKEEKKEKKIAQGLGELKTAPLVKKGLNLYPILN